MTKSENDSSVYHLILLVYKLTTCDWKVTSESYYVKLGLTWFGEPILYATMTRLPEKEKEQEDEHTKHD